MEALPLVVTIPEITVQPLSLEDWDLLELESQWLENGSFLDQVCLVYPDQILTLALPNGASARVRVLPASFASTTEPCVRLTNQTQVLVCPLPVDDTPTWRLKPSRQDIVSSPKLQELAAHLNEELDQWLPVAAKTVIVHPSSFSAIDTGLARIRLRATEDSSPTSAEKNAVVRVEVSQSVPKDAVGTCQIDVSFFRCQYSVMYLFSMLMPMMYFII